MIATKQGIIKKCIVVDEITTQKFFLRKEDKYLTLYKKRKHGIEPIIEISLSNNTYMTPEKFWGLVEKETKGEKIYVEAKELEKLSEKQENENQQSKKECVENEKQKINSKIIELEQKIALKACKTV